MTCPSNLCSIPWTGFSNEPDGKAQPCCLYKGYIEEDENPLYVQEYTVSEIFQSKFMKDLREQFRLNKRPAGCSTCWADEDNGYQSKRIIYNTSIRKEEIDWQAEPTDVSELQLIINNSCNLKCRSCTPSHSTQWQTEIKILTGNTGYPMPKGQSGDELGKLWNDRTNWYKNLTRLEIVGGEPFYVKQWHTILNELIDLDYSKNIDLTFSTNCTLFFSELLERIADNFKSVSVGLSIDGTGATYEYLRHLGKWNDVYYNMKKYHNFADRINIQINLTISWLNALEVTELHELIKIEFPKFTIWNNIVHSPAHMALWSAPENLKKAIEDKWRAYDWLPKYKDTIMGILKYMNSKYVTSDIITDNLSILYKTDIHRKEKLEKSIPALTKYLL
jgi:MoaA/NifB/PqqE/SkfB family radical SAM enzyme